MKYAYKCHFFQFFHATQQKVPGRTIDYVCKGRQQMHFRWYTDRPLCNKMRMRVALYTIYFPALVHLISSYHEEVVWLQWQSLQDLARENAQRISCIGMTQFLQEKHTNSDEVVVIAALSCDKCTIFTAVTFWIIFLPKFKPQMFFNGSIQVSSVNKLRTFLTFFLGLGKPPFFGNFSPVL